MPHYQRPNPYLSAAHGSLTAFDSQQSDSFPYGLRPGRFEVDLTALPRIIGGPVNIMCLASANPGRMWVMGTDRVSLVDVTDGRFDLLAQLALPGVDPIADTDLVELAATELTSIEATTAMALRMFGANPELRTSNGLYTVADADDVVYVNAGSVIHAISTVDADDPAAGLCVLRSLDTEQIFEPYAFPGYPAMVKLIGMNLTYDGHLVLGAFGQLAVVDRQFATAAHVHNFPAGQLLSNSFSVDERDGIYVATGALAPGGSGLMHKLVWTGSRLSSDAADGAWVAEYPGGNWAPAVKVGTGTGSTPTLMGFGDSDDHLVVITDGQDRTHLTAFWRDELPSGWSRIAGTIAVTGGLGDDIGWIQSEQSVATLDWGALVVNNVTAEGQRDRLVDVLVSGPLATPAYGVERFEWDPVGHAWQSVWTRPDLASISQVPVVAVGSRSAAINSFSQRDGWCVTGVDWDTGATVHQSVFGKATAGNGAYALTLVIDGGDMLFTSVAGPVRVPLSGIDPSPIVTSQS